ncbi:hypothetical protein QE364_001218 [Nocardioides zeae]|uniref:Uncharacterized protein n=1 Tax=Nocardioides zeae TaxID=1457234 RepID=A0ACC6IFX4_9ACTN|nr:hypothetical protein [Nocardioides zeae]MDR6209518.1 hypothetical protein [Nocardioides zeae]
MHPMETLPLTGLYLLALGTLLGWPVALQHVAPTALTRVGVRHPRRLLQMHLDYVLMGILLVAVGLALPGAPGWVVAPLVAGAVVNPLLFLPLAFREDAGASLAYRVASTASFLAMSIGAVGAAVHATVG